MNLTKADCTTVIRQRLSADFERTYHFQYTFQSSFCYFMFFNQVVEYYTITRVINSLIHVYASS